MDRFFALAVRVACYHLAGVVWDRASRRRKGFPHTALLGDRFIQTCSRNHLLEIIGELNLFARLGKELFGGPQHRYLIKIDLTTRGTERLKLNLFESFVARHGDLYIHPVLHRGSWGWRGVGDTTHQQSFRTGSRIGRIAACRKIHPNRKTLPRSHRHSVRSYLPRSLAPRISSRCVIDLARS